MRDKFTAPYTPRKKILEGIKCNLYCECPGTRDTNLWPCKLDTYWSCFWYRKITEENQNSTKELEKKIS